MLNPNLFLAAEGNNSAGWIALIVIAVLVFAAYLIMFLVCYKKCPSDKIIVVYGAGIGKNADGTPRSSKCVHGGAVFVWPVIQAYSLLDLAPISIDISIRNAFIKPNGRADVLGVCTVGISTDYGIMQNAAERLRGLPVKEIEELAKDIIIGQLRLVLVENEFEDSYTGREKFVEALAIHIEIELRKIGMQVINVNINELTIKE